jgi:hypothetical protein
MGHDVCIVLKTWHLEKKYYDDTFQTIRAIYFVPVVCVYGKKVYRKKFKMCKSRKEIQRIHPLEKYTNVRLNRNYSNCCR